MINNETAKSTYTVTEGVSEYNIGFAFQYNTDGTPQLLVYKNKMSETPLVYNTNFTINEAQTKIILVSGVEVGDRIDIIRDIPLKQQSTYHVGRIDPKQIETDLDLAVERDQQIQANIDFVGEVPEDHEARIQALEQDVDDIEDLIPTQTTTENQLADKDFVNSSISTATATFRGTYSSLAELEAVTADLNDYGFVESTDAAGNTLYSRYKYDGTNWAFEYNLNNSSFTAAQWAAINSGITSDMVATYHNTTGRNVGDIFFTARLDNGLNGAVACDGTQYNTTDFTGASSVGALLEAGKLPYVSLSQYATLLSTNGSVGVFGWDGTGTIAFKVPSLNDIFVETGTALQVGDYIAPGLPDHNHTYTMSTSSVLRGSGSYGSLTSDTTTFNSGNASASNAIYGASNTVQPQSVRYRAMIQLFISATDEAAATCAAVTSQVAANTSAIAGADYVVESQLPTAQNNYTWYRKYKSGWVEQGGLNHTISLNSSGYDNMIDLPITMTDTNYSALAILTGSYGSRSIGHNTGNSTTTQVCIGGYASAAGTSAINWQVSGVAA